MRANAGLELLLSRLSGVKKSGKEWSATCPHHPDGHASLSVTIGDSGKTLLHCFAGCEPADILADVGLELGDLFPDKRKANGHAKSNGHAVPYPPEPERITCAPGRAAPTPVLTHPAHGKPTTLHVYKTPDNQLLGYVMRFDTTDGKTFCPYTYSAADGWQMKAFSKPRPLYGLERLREHPTGARILVEGEKAADAAAVLAPANAVLSWCGGAGAAKYADLTPLAGQSVILWPDADDAGHKAVAELATRLAAMDCTLRIVDTDGLPDGFDAADLKESLNTWLRPRLRAYVPVAAVEPAVPTPAVSEAPVAPRVASVTPITEARTKQQAKVEPNPADQYAPFSDDAIARAFTESHPELRYVARWSKWLEWGADGWVEDSTLHVYDMVRKTCCDIADITRGATPSAVAGAKSGSKIAAVERLAKADRAHAASSEQWDSDPLMLCTPGGMVDLRTSNIRPVRIDDYARKRTAATPTGECPLWLRFLSEATDGDMDRVAYLRRVAGMCLTGDTREDFLGFIYGPGGNGKSVFIDTLQRIMGTYAMNAGMETFTEQKSERHLTELARLMGARLVVAQETEQGKRWAESRIKLLTGGGKVTANFMRCDPFEFTPELKLLIVGNHKPGLRNVDDAIKRRLHLIPFVHKPAIVDKELRDKLWAERDGILAWMVHGCIEWLCDGLKAPESVRAATSEYFENQDILGQWIADCCEVGTGYSTTIRALYKSYGPYCEAQREFSLRQSELREALLMREGISAGGYKSAPTIQGIQVRMSESAQSAHDARYPDN